jgi:hypothetical protein
MGFSDFSITPIEDKKEFKFQGDTLIQKECVDKERQIYIYERHHKDIGLYAYEVVMGVKKKDPLTGEVKYVYPTSEQFGSYGQFVSAQYKDRIPELIKNLQERRQPN